MSKIDSAIFCQGKVKFYDAHKNQFGFIEVQNSEDQTVKDDVYFKESSLRDQTTIPNDGIRIYCFAKKDKKGYSAQEVIRTGGLSHIERSKYRDLLHFEDTSQLIEDILKKNLQISEFEISSLLRTAIERYKSRDPIIWKFLLKYGDDNQKALLKSYFSELTLSQKLNLSSGVEELLEQIISSHTDYTSIEVSKITDYLIEHKRSNYISDDIWIKYLEFQPSLNQTIFEALKSGFKKKATIDHFAWGASAVQKLIDKIDTGEILLDENFLLELLSEHYTDFYFNQSSSYSSFINQSSTRISFLKNILNLKLSNSFLSDFTEINANMIDQKPLREVLTLLTNLFIESRDVQFENLNKFYTGLVDHFCSNISEIIANQDERTLIKCFRLFKILRLGDVVIQQLSRPSIIELHYQDDSIELDFSKDYKYLGDLGFGIQRSFIQDLLRTAKSDEGKLFWSIIEKIKEDIFNHEDKNLDPSSVFIIYILSEIKGKVNLSNNPLNTSKLFEFVYTQLIDETLIEQTLNGYFEKCTGRAYDDNSEDGTVNRTRHPPCEYCEGRMMIDQQTQKPVVSNNSQFKKYWCRNSTCLLPTRQEEKEHLTFSAILHQLGFTEIDYFVGFVNGWVNKINTYLEHLSCRECNNALKPTKVGSGYYRVSYFRCTNINCEESSDEKLIYLTHCINPKCEEVIDSRESTQCSHDWYICPHCLGCCSTVKIQKRIEYHDLINKLYHGPTDGHKDMGKLYCPECGKFIISKKNLGIYDRMLDRFKKLKTKHPNIIKWGQRSSDNKYWFLLKKLPKTTYEDFDEKINKLSKLGFSVGDKYEYGQEIALISEKTSDSIITCKNCFYSVNTKELYKEGDFYRARAIEKWHEKIFSYIN